MTPNIDYIPMSPLATAVRNTMQPTEHGGGAKKIIAVAAMVAIPFVAPAISASIGLSASIGATMGSAVAGGIMGGVASAATGGDWRKGMLGGAISGGIAGYMSTPTATPTDGMTGPGFDAPVSDPLLAPTSAAPTASVDPMIGPTMADGTYGGLSAAQEAQVGLSSLDYNDALLADQTFVGGGTTQSATGDALDATAPPPKAPPPKAPPPKAPKGTFGERFQAGLETAYSPENLGRASLQMGGNMLTNALVQSEYSEQQQELIDQRKAVVARLEAQGAEVDTIKLAEARKLLQQAMQVDPTYLARQKANAAKSQDARRTNEAVRRAGSSGRRAGLTDSIRRRGALAGGKHAASAFDSGYQGGLEEKIALQKGGVGMLPTSAGLSGYYANLGSQYDSAEEARDKEREGYNQLFGFATTQPGA